MTQLFYPGQLACTTKIFSHKGNHYMVVTASMHYDLFERKPVLFDEAPGTTSKVMEKLLAPHNALNTMDDEGYPKLSGEWLLYGHAYSKNLKEKGVGAVSVKLGESQKTLAVFGERKWSKDAAFTNVLSDPHPVDAVPLLYEFAYGGEGYDMNPAGRGKADDSVMPMVELPNDLILSRGQEPKRPATFVRIPSYWEPRLGIGGTYSEHWMKVTRPALPDDLDWNSFMTAPEDQRIKGFFKGDEAYELVGLNSHHPVLKGHLPGYRVRLFYAKDNNMRLTDLKPQLDTVIFYPDHQFVALYWRAVLQLKDFRGSQIDYIVGAYEGPKDYDRDLRYYQEDFNWRKPEAEYDSLYQVMVTGPLVPSDEISAQRIKYERAMKAPPPESMGGNPTMADALKGAAGRFEESLNKMQDKLNKKADKQEAAGQEGMKGVGEYLKAKIDEARGSIESVKKMAAESEKRAKNLDDFEDEPDPMFSGSPETQRMVDRVEAIIPYYVRNPKKINADNLVLRKTIAVSAIMDEFNKSRQLQMLNISKTQAEQQLEYIQRQMREVPESAVHLKKSEEMLEQTIAACDAEIAHILYNTPKPMKTLPRLEIGAAFEDESMAEAMKKLQEVQQKLQGSTSKLTVQQRGVLETPAIDPNSEGTEIHTSAAMEEKLSGLKGTFIEGYRLLASYEPMGLSPHKDQRAVEAAMKEAYRLGQRDFSFGDYACSRLIGEDFSGCDFSNTLMEQIDFKNANLSGCDFRGAVLVRCDFSGADLRGADLRGANFGASSFIGTNLQGARVNNEIPIYQAYFEKADLKALDLRGMRLFQCAFNHCNLQETNWEGTSIFNNSFNGANLKGANFKRSAISDSYFENAILDEVEMERTGLGGVSFGGASFKRSSVTFTSFGRLNFEEGPGVNFDFAKIRNVSFSDGKIHNSSFKGAELKNISTQNSSFERCDFSGADMELVSFNDAGLKRSQFVKANLRSANFMGSNLKDANLKGANLYGAEFARSTMGGTDFSNANLERTIIEDWRPS